MAAIWPDYARTEADGYAVQDDPDVQRSAFDDGAVRQAREYTAAFTARQVLVHLESDARYAEFRTWIRAHGQTWFTWTDPDDGVRRRVRVRGGSGGVAYRAVVQSGRRRWEARCALEGLWTDTV